MSNTEFTKKIWSFYSKNKRTFPWRETTDPYAIMVSEFMLQQTQTQRVVPKYEAFLNKFPTLQHLANSSQSQILQNWQGLGYNRRALYLHQSAQTIVSQFEGYFPQDKDTLQKLPGIGPYTAAAITTFAFNKPQLFIETNIRAVFIYFFFPNRTDVNDKEIMPLIEQTVDPNNPREWYYALMDYGAYLKENHPNPSRRSKHHLKQSKFEGSNRQKRGAILRYLLQKEHASQDSIIHDLDIELADVQRILQKLEEEGFVIQGKTSVNVKK